MRRFVAARDDDLPAARFFDPAEAVVPWRVVLVAAVFFRVGFFVAVFFELRAAERAEDADFFLPVVRRATFFFRVVFFDAEVLPVDERARDDDPVAFDDRLAVVFFRADFFRAML